MPHKAQTPQDLKARYQDMLERDLELAQFYERYATNFIGTSARALLGRQANLAEAAKYYTDAARWAALIEKG